MKLSELFNEADSDDLEKKVVTKIEQDCYGWAIKDKIENLKSFLNKHENEKPSVPIEAGSYTVINSFDNHALISSKDGDMFLIMKNDMPTQLGKKYTG